MISYSFFKKDFIMTVKKIICLIVPSLEMGGMERVVSLVSNYAAKEGCSVYIICLLRDNRAYDINESIVVLTPEFIYKKSIFMKFRIALKLINDLKKINPTTVIAFSEVFNPLSIVCCKLANVPVYISDRSNPKTEFNYLAGFLRKLTYPLANGMIAQTTIAKRTALERKYNNNIMVIPNPLREIINSSEIKKEKIVISVGRLVKSKNFNELIDIFLEADFENKWKLLILGDGPEKEFLQQKININGASNRIELIGSVKNVDEYLSKASIFAFTSISEGFPNALSEAIAYPLPCIAYDCCAGPSDLIENDKNGFLIPLYDKVSFETHLKKMMVSPSLRHDFTVDYMKNRKRYHRDFISKKYLSFTLNE